MYNKYITWLNNHYALNTVNNKLSYLIHLFEAIAMSNEYLDN